MINISGQINRSFVFPAPLESAFYHYRDVEKLMTFLPHISIVDFDKELLQLRTLYSTRELGTYDINILCDLDFVVDEANYSFHVSAVDRLPAIKPHTSLRSTLARGYFTCNSIFSPVEDSDETVVDYHIAIRAKLPTPKGLRLMPGRVVSGIVSGVTNGRMKEIADGFVLNSILAFKQAQGA